MLASLLPLCLLLFPFIKMKGVFRSLQSQSMTCVCVCAHAHVRVCVCVCVCRRPRALPFLPISLPLSQPSRGPGIVSGTPEPQGPGWERGLGLHRVGASIPLSQNVSNRSKRRWVGREGVGDLTVCGHRKATGAHPPTPMLERPGLTGEGAAGQ